MVDNKDYEIYKNTLKKHFGYEDFRDKQFDIIKSIIEDKRDVCAIMFTGAGKSLCYQFPAVYSEKVSIVISPLISLMDDQILKLKELNISATCLNSTVINKNMVKNMVLNGTFLIVYTTPEYFVTQEEFVTELSEKDMLSGIYIDESHCISTWGNDFRESYRNLNCIREWVEDVPIIALTATATEKVQQDIIHRLGLNKPLLIKTTFDRPNLKIHIVKKSKDPIDDLVPIVKSNEPTIIYCQTRKMTDSLNEILQEEGIKCESYHAGMDNEDRKRVHESFVLGEFTCIIATVAFGMGIDITIRNVIHYGMPKDIESYYQEIGRAGRDGVESQCYTFYNMKDNATNDYFINQIDNKAYRNHRMEAAAIMKQYIFSGDCRRKFILNYFGEEYNLPEGGCGGCDNCAKVGNNPKRDLTDEARLILKVMDDTGNSYGGSMLILIIRGSKSKNITAKMKRLSGYDKGGGKSNEWWKVLLRLVITNGFAREKPIVGGHGFTLCITKEGKHFLRDTTAKFEIIPPDELT